MAEHKYMNMHPPQIMLYSNGPEDLKWKISLPKVGGGGEKKRHVCKLIGKELVL